MEYKKAKEHYGYKKHGKCIKCSHGSLKYKCFNKKVFCSIRDRFVEYTDGDFFVIKFCKYYEEREKTIIEEEQNK